VGAVGRAHLSCEEGPLLVVLEMSELELAVEDVHMRRSMVYDMDVSS
jgi:hypothetical protein